jgi:hypothetical protein
MSTESSSNKRSISNTRITSDQFGRGLRNRIWNIISRNYFPDDLLSTALGRTGSYYYFIYNLYDGFFKEDADFVLDGRSKNVKYFQKAIKVRYNVLNWKGTCDFLEFIVKYEEITGVDAKKFIEECNLIFDNEKVNYHFYDKKIVNVDSNEEVKELDYASLVPYDQVNQHLTSALDMLNNSVNPSYRNSIKESISAVESLIKLITNQHNVSFSHAIDIITKDFQLEASLKAGLEKIYGYASSANGIRHAIIERPNTGEEEARFMFIVCVSFINYILRKKNKIHKNPD